MPVNPSWTAGACSTKALIGDGWFSFSVPIGVVGVFVGVTGRDETTDPSEPLIGLMFSSGTFHVKEGGVQVTPNVPYSKGQVFSIARSGNRLYCCSGAPGAPAPGAILRPLGAVVRTYAAGYAVSSGGNSPRTDLNGPLLLDASLLAGGDTVVDASLTLVNASAEIRMEPMALSASDDGASTASPVFMPPWATADNGRTAHLTMLAPVLLAASGSYGAADISFEPMTLFAVPGMSSMNGASVSFGYPTSSGAGPGENRAQIWLAPIGARGGNKDHAEGSALSLPMFARAYGDKHAGAGLRFVVGLQGLSGPVDVYRDVTDGGFVSDATYVSHYTMVVDGALTSDELIAGAQSPEMVEDAAIASMSVMLGASALLEDGALVGDELLAAVSDALLQDVAWASSELLVQSSGAVLLEDGALAGDAALPYAFVDLDAEALAWGDALIASVVLLEDEALVGDEVIAASMQGPALLEDGTLVGDELLAWTDAFALLQDTAVASEQLFMKTPGLVAWVMNTDTGAVSWYDNWAFTSIAVVGGRVFAAGPDGLHLLGGDLDGTEPIDARVQFGYTEFGGYDNAGAPKPSEPKKRLDGLWFGYHASGELEATVETYGQGYGPFTYAMAARAADQPRNNRIVPGKGLNARYWRIGVANTAGCAFEVHSVSAEVAQSTRRL